MILMMLMISLMMMMNVMGGEPTDTTDGDDADDNDESSVPGNDAEMETDSKEQHFVASPHDEDEDDDDDDHHYDDDDNDYDEGDGSWLAILGHIIHIILLLSLLVRLLGTQRILFPARS